VFDVAFDDRAVRLPRSETLVVADLHVGRAAASDVEAPLGERADLTERLASLVERHAPAAVVVAGDVLHEFGRVSARTGETLAALDAVCGDAGAELVLVAGNHDAALDRVWDGPVHDALAVEAGGLDVVVCHGHEDPDAHGGDSGDSGADDGADAPDLYVVGHDHPTITIEGQTRPCFLYGEGVHRGADLLMLPAFTRVAAGVAVDGMRARDFQSPLVTDADALRPVVWDDARGEALTFPPLGRFRRML
jgi:hypothetical protein